MCSSASLSVIEKYLYFFVQTMFIGIPLLVSVRTIDIKKAGKDPHIYNETMVVTLYRMPTTKCQALELGTQLFLLILTTSLPTGFIPIFHTRQMRLREMK